MKNLTILLFTLISFSFTGNVFSQPVVGQEAPHLSGLKVINNKLPNFENKFLIIDFWATWCGPCIITLPHINNLAERYKDKIVFLAVSNEKENDVSVFLKKNKYNNLIFCLDIEGNLFSKFEIRSVPRYYIISPKNIILASGLSYDLTDHFLDSLTSNSLKTEPYIKSNIKISQDTLQKISSIEIKEITGSKPYLTQSGYTFIIRDSLNKVLPFLAGVKVPNRIRFQNLPHKMIEVKIFSRNTPCDSLKMFAHNQVLASFGISRKLITEHRTVYHFHIINPALLKDKNTFVEDGVLKKQELSNDSTMRFDNYSLNDFTSFLEGPYYPRILYAQTSSTVEFDWDLPIVNPTLHAYVSFDRFKEILRKVSGIEIKESQKDEIITVYN